MRGLVGIGCKVATVLIVAFCAFGTVQAANIDYDFTGYDLASGNLETILGPKVTELNAKTYGFSFGGFDGPLRNLNLISQVYQAEQAVVIGIGDGGTPIELEAGGYTFVYPMDYSILLGGLPNSSVNDLQIIRVIENTVFDDVSNPGEGMALAEIIGGAYNTDSEFGGGSGTPPFEPYPAGMTGEHVDSAIDYGMPGYLTDELEYSFPTDDQIYPGTKAMVFAFCSPDVRVWQMGWGSLAGESLEELADRQDVGHTGEGANVIGGGANIDGIPVLIPAVPEPGCLMLLLFGGMSLLKRR